MIRFARVYELHLEAADGSHFDTIEVSGRRPSGAFLPPVNRAWEDVTSGDRLTGPTGTVYVVRQVVLTAAEPPCCARMEITSAGDWERTGAGVCLP